MTNRLGGITYFCRTEGCGSEITFRRDDHLPKADEWLCDACETAQEEQWRDVWAEQEIERQTPQHTPALKKGA